MSPLVPMHSIEIEMDKMHEILKFSSLFYTRSSAILNFIRILHFTQKVFICRHFFINTFRVAYEMKNTVIKHIGGK